MILLKHELLISKAASENLDMIKEHKYKIKRQRKGIKCRRFQVKREKTMNKSERLNMLENTAKLPEYSFLNENEHLGSNIMFLTFGGSYAYGTNIEGSDIDIRGVATNRKEEILGLQNFEQAIDDNTDTTVYGFKKYISLVSACNPNVIEMLSKNNVFTRVSPSGKLLLDNANLFLSRRAANAFGGYATAQLRRMQVSLARSRVTPEMKGNFILSTCDSAMRTLEEAHHIQHGVIKLALSDKINDEGNFIINLYPDAAYKEFLTDGLPLTEYTAFLGELRAIVKSYGSLGRRNDRAKEKSDKQLNKHCMHLVRLYKMAFDILEKGEINTYRENDREELLDIRNGKYMQEDGTMSQELYALVDEYEKRLKRDYNETSLPNKPDMKKIEELVVAVNMASIKE